MSQTLCVELALLAAVVTFLGLCAVKKKLGTPTWTTSRNRTFGTFTEYLTAFVAALVITFIVSDWAAIASLRLEQSNYALSQTVEVACMLAIFFTVFFGTVCENKFTRLRLILTLVSGVILATCVAIILSAK